jgi:four helix bundle protein
MTDKPNVIIEMTFGFALNIIEFTEELEAKRKFNMANQLFRCGTSIGANVREAQGAESKSDFIHKCKIAYKEAEESEYWLLLCRFSKNYPFEERLLIDIENIKKVLGKIISTSKK